jgi:hypothetical protein
MTFVGKVGGARSILFIATGLSTRQAKVSEDENPDVLD